MSMRLRWLVPVIVLLGVLAVPSVATTANGLPQSAEPTAQRPTTPVPPGQQPPAPGGIQVGPPGMMRGPEAQPLNVKVDVTITDQTGSAQPFKKTISVVVADRQRSSTRSSIELPVATTSFATMGDKGEGKPISSYTYRRTGLNLDVSELSIDGNNIRLRLTLEYTPVDEKTAEGEGKNPGGPSFASFQQTLSLVLDNGKPLLVAQSSDPVPSRTRSQTVEVKATILK